MANQNKLFECQQMFRHACAFAECADLALDKFRHDTADIEWYSTPAVVNSAFACEVYLKALLLFHDIDFKDHLKGKKQHEIKELFDLLPEETRDWIKPTVMNQCGRWTDPWERGLLLNISNAFIEWRYNYENDWSKSSIMHIDVSFLTTLRNALREACSLLFYHMTWEDYER